MTRINAKVMACFMVLFLGAGIVSAETGRWKDEDYSFVYWLTEPSYLNDYDSFYKNIDKLMLQGNKIAEQKHGVINSRRSKFPNHYFELIGMLLTQYSLDNGDIYNLVIAKGASWYSISILITDAKISKYQYFCTFNSLQL
jgi:hypothetical protein